MAYCLWALLDSTGDSVWSQLSIVPFVLAILSYALLAARRQAGAPEQVFARDRSLQVLGLVWLAVYGVGVYVGT